MNNLRLTFLCTWLIVPLVSAAATPAPTAQGPHDEALRALGRDWLEHYHGIGLSIGIYDDGKSSFYNFGSTQLEGNRPPTKDTIYEIGSISKTMTGQLLARAIVEGRAQPSDEIERYLGEPYPNLANEGEKVRLIHLANMTSQLMDNIPDMTQVRLVKGEPLEATRMAVISRYTREEFLRQLHRVAPRLKPGSDPAHSNVASMLLGVALEKIYGEPFETILQREIEKPLRMGSGTQPDTRLLAKRLHREERAAAALLGADGLSVRGSSLQHRRAAAIRGLAAGGAGCLGEAGAPAHLVHAGQAPVGGDVLDRVGNAARTAAAVFGRDLRIRERGGAVSRGEAGAWCCSRTRPRKARRIPCAHLSAEIVEAVAAGAAQPAASRRSACGSVSVLPISMSFWAATPLWFMSMRPEKWAPSAMPTRGAKMLPVTLAV